MYMTVGREGGQKEVEVGKNREVGRRGQGEGKEWIEELPPLSSSPSSLPFLPSTGKGKGKRMRGEAGGDTEGREKRKGR